MLQYPKSKEDASVWSLSASIRSHLAFFVEKAKELEDITQRGSSLPLEG
jgi:hypothetical protein